jgi:hypothetical protein
LDESLNGDQILFLDGSVGFRDLSVGGVWLRNADSLIWVFADLNLFFGQFNNSVEFQFP